LDGLLMKKRSNGWQVKLKNRKQSLEWATFCIKNLAKKKIGKFPLSVVHSSSLLKFRRGLMQV